MVEFVQSLIMTKMLQNLGHKCCKDSGNYYLNYGLNGQQHVRLFPVKSKTNYTPYSKKEGCITLLGFVRLYLGIMSMIHTKSRWMLTVNGKWIKIDS